MSKLGESAAKDEFAIEKRQERGKGVNRRKPRGEGVAKQGIPFIRGDWN
jgi:hypothetical protein